MALSLSRWYLNLPVNFVFYASEDLFDRTKGVCQINKTFYARVHNRCYIIIVYWDFDFWWLLLRSFFNLLVSFVLFELHGLEAKTFLGVKTKFKCFVFTLFLMFKTPLAEKPKTSRPRNVEPWNFSIRETNAQRMSAAPGLSVSG